MLPNLSVYSIQLLNDLHNHFPDLLYRPEQFQNVQDVLMYIIRVANQNPYANGYNSYLRNSFSRLSTNESQVSSQPSSTTASTPSSTTASTTASTPSSTTASTASSTTASTASSSLPLHSGLSSSSRIRFTMPLQSSNQVNHSNSQDDVINNFIMNVLGSALMGGSNSSSSSTYSYENFLQPVTVRPTQNQIDSSTYTMILQSNSQDNCAICQDPMELQQEIRIIDQCGHSFHKSCIDPWFNENVRCPTCRYDIRGSSSSSSSTFPST